MMFATTNAFAAKIPDNVKTVIKKDFAQADFRFDGLITMPDGTIYLPLYPALVKKPEKLEVKSTLPLNKQLKDLPDVVIFNNDFVLLKVITDMKGRKTVLNSKEPPIEVRTGLLPQDLLVPSGLVIPDSIKGIMGNLQIPTALDAGLKVQAESFLEGRTVKDSIQSKNSVASVSQLKDKTLYIATCYSKNIQVVEGENAKPSYALAQKSVPIDIKAAPDGKFLLVTTYSRTFLDIISLADERVIKQIDFTTQPEEIIIDSKANKAYVSSPSASLIYIVDLSTMTLKQKIKIKGMCERLYLSEDGTKLFYADKKTNNIWAIELNNDFAVKNIGSFPNISKIVYAQGKIYISSRTKNRVAIIDYATLGLLSELEVNPKPVDMVVYKNKVFVLSAHQNTIQVIDTQEDALKFTISLNTYGFSTKICPIKGSNLAIITDTKTDKYSVVDMDKLTVIKTNKLEIPVSKMVILPSVRKISK